MINPDNNVGLVEIDVNVPPSTPAHEAINPIAPGAPRKAGSHVAVADNQADDDIENIQLWTPAQPVLFRRAPQQVEHRVSRKLFQG